MLFVTLSILTPFSVCLESSQAHRRLHQQSQLSWQYIWDSHDPDHGSDRLTKIINAYLNWT